MIINYSVNGILSIFSSS